MDSHDYQACRLCPRQCGVDRTRGQRGVCCETAVCRVASACAHFGEEPSFSGTFGSGTIFFAGCSCRCFFCQNHQISLGNAGQAVTAEQLYDKAVRLVRSGVHNINFVTPDHYWPHVRAVSARLRALDGAVPILYNCSGYQNPGQVAEIAEFVDIFMPDFKFSDASLAQSCMGDSRYPELALAAIREMVRCKGFLRPWDPTGARTAATGVLVRHLVLPGQVENSIRVLDRLAAACGPGLPLSVMSQYSPTPDCLARGALNRPLSAREYKRVCAHVEELGFECVYVQPEFGDPEFMPDFDRQAPFPGPPG